MDLQTLFLKWGLRIKVLHRLPGRLRLEVPALRKVPPERQEFARNLMDSVVLPAGITSVEASFLTGSVLLRYDPDAMTERQVWLNIQGLVSALGDHRAELESIGRDNAPSAIERLNGVLDKANRKNSKQNENDTRS